MSQPSIVLLFADQLRGDALGVAGNRYARTPNIDHLANTGVRFETCITNSPLCRPARISLMTGLGVTEHGFDSNLRVPVPGSLPSHVSDLQNAGYHTAVVGKTHLHNGGGHLDDHKDKLKAWGFDTIVELPDAERHDVRSVHADWLTSTTPSGDIDKWQRWRDLVVHGEGRWMDEPPWNLTTEDHLDMCCAREVVQLIEGHQQGPMYLQVCFPGPHPPFDAPREFVLDPTDAPGPITGKHTGPKSPLAARMDNRRWRGTPEQMREMIAAYHAKVRLVDQCIGQVLDAVNRCSESMPSRRLGDLDRGPWRTPGGSWLDGQSVVLRICFAHPSGDSSPPGPVWLGGPGHGGPA